MYCTIWISAKCVCLHCMWCIPNVCGSINCKGVHLSSQRLLYRVVITKIRKNNSYTCCCLPCPGKKKKKNRFASRNKTAPSPYDDDIPDSDHTSGSDRQTYSTPRGLSTPPQFRSNFRASRSPRLAPMEEQENELENHCK